MVKTSTSARSPLSPTLWPANAFIWWQSALFALTIVVSSIVLSVVFAVIWAIIYGFATLKTMSLPFVLAVQVVSYLPILALVLFVLPLIAKRSLHDLGFRLPTPAEVGIGLAGSIAMFVVSSAIGLFEESVLHVKVQEQAVDLLKTAHGSMAFLFALLACVFAPFVEEFVFRAFAFNAFLRYVPFAAAAILSALLFGAVHGSLSAWLPLSAAGLVLAVVYYRTGALSASMISHAGFNLISVVGFFVFKIS